MIHGEGVERFHAILALSMDLSTRVVCSVNDPNAITCLNNRLGPSNCDPIHTIKHLLHLADESTVLTGLATKGAHGLQFVFLKL